MRRQLIILFLWIQVAFADDVNNQSCSAETLTLYNQPIHIAAIFIIFAVSGSGVLIPIVSKFMPFLGIPSRFITFGKSFGVGVIISTAFIHMLQPANEKLTSVCLGDTWHENYPSFAMLFCMCSIFAMQLIEYLATTQLEHHFHSSALCVDHHHHDNSTVKSATTTTTTTTHVNNMATTTIPDTPQSPFQCEIHHYHPEHVEEEEEEENNNNTQPKSSSVTMIGESVAKEDLYIYGRRAFSGNNTDEDDKDKLKHTPYSTCPEHWDSSSTRIAESMKDTKRCLSTIVLECGILAHSIIIGITMGVTGQDEFTGLMIAICFHQFFEGFALGARIAEVNRINCKKAIMMASFFAWTTPVGTAIGVGISSSYNGNSAAALLAQGIFDSISSGILIYVGLVNLLASEMIFDDRFKKMRKSTRFGCFLFMYAGAAVMAIIGIWI